MNCPNSTRPVERSTRHTDMASEVTKRQVSLECVRGELRPPFFTVFTPTYNRRELLPRVYDSLKMQTCKDFEWVIVDDGSTDDTYQLVRSWPSHENGFSLRYHYQENGDDD